MDAAPYLARSFAPVLFLLIPAVGAALRTRHARSFHEKLEIWQRWWAIGALGCSSLCMTVAFLAVPDVMAEVIGFPRTPFVFEIACANLGMAVMGFRAASASARERITIGVGAGMFLWGATIGHLYQWFANGDHAAGNTGGVLATDVIIPAVMIVLAVQARRARTTSVLAAQPVA